MPLVLASQSPRRKQLLELAGLEFDVIVKDTDETWPADLSFTEIPVHIARNKALAVRESKVFQRYENNATILAADSIVLWNDTVIGKPANRLEAIRTLSELSGNKHLVITGVVILSGGKEVAFAETTEVNFHPLTAAQIAYYVDECRPYDKAGAYAIQEWIGAVGIKSINGDFYNVMGLPISRVVHELERIDKDLDSFSEV